MCGNSRSHEGVRKARRKTWAPLDLGRIPAPIQTIELLPPEMAQECPLPVCCPWRQGANPHAPWAPTFCDASVRYEAISRGVGSYPFTTVFICIPIILITESIVVGRVAYREYLDTETYWKLFPYDYCSITHNQPEEFALPGTAAFTVLKPPFFIPKLDHLSESDCRTLLMLYNGDPSACTPVDCAAFMPPVAVSTPPTRTTLSVTKGPSPANTTMSLDAADTTMRTTQPTAEFLKDNSKSATKKTGVVDSVTGAPTSIACPSVVCPVCTCATHAPCPTTAARPMIKVHFR